jgi:hypothetical protein
MTMRSTLFTRSARPVALLQPAQPARVLALTALATVGAVAATLSGCSSSSSPAGPACDPCEGGVAVGPTTNPDGVPYPNPAGGYGETPRSGKTPGNIIANLHFNGYLNGDMAKGLQVISLANYYDPCRKRLKLLHLSVAGVWCVPCNMETDALVAAQSLLQSDQVVVLQALSDGAMEGVPATVADLNYWVGYHKVNFTEMLDPGLMEFGAFFNASAIPWNADVDPRTMELIDSTTGWDGDVMTEIQTGLDAINEAPLYPIPATACSDQ